MDQFHRMHVVYGVAHGAYSVVCTMVVDHGAVGVSSMDPATTKNISHGIWGIHGGHTAENAMTLTETHSLLVP